MRPSESEVSAYAWLEPPVLEAIAATEEGAETPGIVPSALPATIRWGTGTERGCGAPDSSVPRHLVPCHLPSRSITELSGGSSRVTHVPTATLLPAAPVHGDDVEWVSAGTKFALRLCLESLGHGGHGGHQGSVTPLPSK